MADTVESELYQDATGWFFLRITHNGETQDQDLGTDNQIEAAYYADRIIHQIRNAMA